MGKAKPFSISKRVVFKAYKRVKANKGAAGVDGESIADFEKDLKNNRNYSAKKPKSSKKSLDRVFL